MFRKTISLLTVAVLARAAVAEDHKCAGMITKIDGEMVTVKSDSAEYQMKVEPATKITAGDKPVMINELKVGQKVSCVCDKKDGELLCKTMEIMRDTP